MKVECDSATDTLTVTLRQGELVESDEDKPGLILDYDEVGNLLSIEVLDASRRVEEPRSVPFQGEDDERREEDPLRAAWWLRRDCGRGR
jgi:uncharacterized protein YuzE